MRLVSQKKNICVHCRAGEEEKKKKTGGVKNEVEKGKYLTQDDFFNIIHSFLFSVNLFFFFLVLVLVLVFQLGNVIIYPDYISSYICSILVI